MKAYGKIMEKAQGSVFQVQFIVSLTIMLTARMGRIQFRQIPEDNSPRGDFFFAVFDVRQLIGGNCITLKLNLNANL